MRYHLRLCKALSYTGVVSATKKQPDVYVDDKATAEAAVATGYFNLVERLEDEKHHTSETGHIDKAQLEEMKLEALKKLAADMKIDDTGFKKKIDYIEAISAVEVIPGDAENEPDYGSE